MESEQARKTADFNTRFGLDEITRGLFRIVLITGALYGLNRVLFRGDLESIFSSWYVWILPCLCIVSMPLVALSHEPYQHLENDGEYKNALI